MTRKILCRSVEFDFIVRSLQNVWTGYSHFEVCAIRSSVHFWIWMHGKYAPTAYKKQVAEIFNIYIYCFQSRSEDPSFRDPGTKGILEYPLPAISLGIQPGLHPHERYQPYPILIAMFPFPCRNLAWPFLVAEGDLPFEIYSGFDAIATWLNRQTGRGVAPNTRSSINSDAAYMMEKFHFLLVSTCHFDLFAFVGQL
jgi:hypothetical protein